MPGFDLAIIGCIMAAARQVGAEKGKNMNAGKNENYVTLRAGGGVEESGTRLAGLLVAAQGMF